MIEFTKVWERPENAEKNCPIACYSSGGELFPITIFQYGEKDFRPSVNHIMSVCQKRKSFESLEDAVAYVNSDDYR